MPGRREVRQLTEQLDAERRQRERDSEREREERDLREKAREDERDAEVRAGLRELASLASDFLRDRRDEAELIRIPRTRRAGLFRDRHKTTIEEVPAWEVGAGFGVERKHWKEGTSEHEWHYRVMVTADARVVIGHSPHDYREPKPLRPSTYRSPRETHRDQILKDCGIYSRTAISRRAEELRAGDYTSDHDWGEVWNPPMGRF